MSIAGYEIKSPGFSLTRNGLPFRPPVTRGLKRQYIFGQDMTLSCRDYSGEGGDAVPVGSPVLSDYYAQTASNSKYFNTALADSANGSIVLAVRSTGDNSGPGQRAMYAATSRSGSGNGRNIYCFDNTRIAITTTTNLGSPAFEAMPLTMTFTNWALIIATWTAAGQAIYNMTGGTGNSMTFINSPVLGTNPWHIGNGSTSVVGPANIGCSAIHDVVLTADERAAIYAFWKGYFGRRGISI